jgi:hypothetical protein
MGVRWEERDCGVCQGTGKELKIVRTWIDKQSSNLTSAVYAETAPTERLCSKCGGTLKRWRLYDEFGPWESEYEY